jgi:type I restriction enzyme, S subunit
MKTIVSDWALCKLDDLGFVGRGKSRHRPRNDPLLYGGRYPFIQTADVMAADPFITSFSQTYSELGLSQSKLWPPGTLCMTIAGENTAKTAILTFEACFPDSVVGFVPDPERASVTFVKYALDQMKTRFRAISRGATQDNLSLEKLLSFQIPTPPLGYQRQISSILSAYDDLIENNTRRIAILEEMARRIYEEWFVRFRFPGHEKVRMVESEVGLIPDGWPVTPILDLCDFEKGIEPGRKAYFDTQNFERIPFLRVGDLSKRSADIFVSRQVTKGRTLTATDIAISLDGTIGVVRRGLEGAFSGGIRRVVRRTNNLGTAYVYQYLKSNYAQEVIKAHANGATILHAGSSLKYLLLPLPPAGVIGRFEEIVSPMLDLVLKLDRKNANLRATRDLLIPKLISGELDVSHSPEPEVMAA